MTNQVIENKDTFAVVYYNPGRENPSRKGMRFFDNVSLHPGRNRLDSKEFNKVKTHPDFIYFETLGAVEIVSQDVPVETDISLDTLSVKQALDLIKGEVHIDQVKKWQYTEGLGKRRTTVLNALAVQIKDIETGNL